MTACATTTSRGLSTGLFIIRLTIGLVFMLHGSGKLFGILGGTGMAKFTEAIQSMNMPMPVAGAWAAALAEFVGGACLVLGLFTRIAVIPMIFTMGVAFFVAHKAKLIGEGNGEHALTLGLLLLGLLFTGPGCWSIDGTMCRRKAVLST